MKQAKKLFNSICLFLAALAIWNCDIATHAEESEIIIAPGANETFEDSTVAAGSLPELADGSMVNEKPDEPAKEETIKESKSAASICEESHASDEMIVTAEIIIGEETNDAVEKAARGGTDSTVEKSVGVETDGTAENTVGQETDDVEGECITDTINTSEDLQGAAPFEEMGQTAEFGKAGTEMLAVSQTSLLDGGQNLAETGQEEETFLSPMDTSAPLDLTEAFVERLYQTTLGRASDPGGLAYWTGFLKSGKMTAANVVVNFFNSREYQGKNKGNVAIVTDFYQVMLNRSPDSGGLAYWKRFLDTGMTHYYLTGGFAGSSEFRNLCNKYGITAGGVQSPYYRDKNFNRTSFVSRLYTDCLERKYDVSGLEFWCKYIHNGGTASQVASGFVFSREYANKNTTNGVYVEMLYRTMLGRSADANGRAYWVGRLGGLTSREEVFNGFLRSKEFKNKCDKAKMVVGSNLPSSLRIVFVGDSRTIDLFANSDATVSGAVHDGIKVFGKHGEDFDYMKSTLDQYGINSFDAVVSWMGANDIGDFSQYQSYYEGLLSNGKRLVLCTVGPTVDNSLVWWDRPNYYNSNMEKYNAQLKAWAAQHNVKVIDLYQFIQSDSRITIDSDGIHYSPKPNPVLWNYILSQLKS